MSGEMNLVKIGVRRRSIEPTTDDMQVALVSDDPKVVTCSGQRAKPAPAVSFGIVDLMPRNACPLVVQGRRAPTKMRSGLPEPLHRRLPEQRQRGYLGPTVLGSVVGIGIGERIGIWIRKAAERVGAVGIGRHGYVIGSSRQGRRADPTIFSRIINMVVAAIDPAANDVEAARQRRPNAHFGGWDLGNMARDPATRRSAGAGGCRLRPLRDFGRREVVA